MIWPKTNIFRVPSQAFFGATLETKQFYRSEINIYAAYRATERLLFSKFRSMSMSQAWLANTRPECLFEISQLAQVTKHMFKSDKNKLLHQLIRALKYAIENRILLKIRKLDLSLLKLSNFPIPLLPTTMNFLRS